MGSGKIERVGSLASIELSEDKIWISVERTVNLGNYENIKLMAGTSKSVLPDSDVVAEAKDLFAQFEDLLEERSLRYET
jgi:hypothetical protein